MISKLLVKLCGNIWRVKSACNSQSTLLSKMAKILYESYQYENSSSIAWNSKFSSEPCLPHGIKGIFISGGAKIGHNCVIFQQVTIGSITLPDSKNKGAPLIGDNVYIGAGAKIVGNITVGDNVRIGANTVITKNVPANSVVISSKQEIIHKKTILDNRFYSYRGEWVFFNKGKYERVQDPQILKLLKFE